MRYRDLLAFAKLHGVIEKTGKGSERIWILETPPGSGKGPQYTMKCHGEGMEVAPGTQNAMLRRFHLKDAFRNRLN